MKRLNWNLVGGACLLVIAVYGVFHMLRNAVSTYGEMHSALEARSALLDRLATIEMPPDFDVVLRLPIDLSARGLSANGPPAGGPPAHAEFKSLAPAKRAVVMNAYARYNGLPPDQRKVFLAHLETWQAMSIQERMRARVTVH